MFRGVKAQSTPPTLGQLVPSSEIPTVLAKVSVEISLQLNFSLCPSLFLLPSFPQESLPNQLLAVPSPSQVGFLGNPTWDNLEVTWRMIWWGLVMKVVAQVYNSRWWQLDPEQWRDTKGEWADLEDIQKVKYNGIWWWNGYGEEWCCSVRVKNDSSVSGTHRGEHWTLGLRERSEVLFWHLLSCNGQVKFRRRHWL